MLAAGLLSVLVVVCGISLGNAGRIHSSHVKGSLICENGGVISDAWIGFYGEWRRRRREVARLDVPRNFTLQIKRQIAVKYDTTKRGFDTVRINSSFQSSRKSATRARRFPAAAARFGNVLYTFFKANESLVRRQLQRKVQLRALDVGL